jgi:hypothetical protein
LLRRGAFEVSQFEYENLKIQVEDRRGVTYVNWTGESDSRDPAGSVGPYLSLLAKRLRGRRVQITFDQLEYMNSATVTPIMQFVKELSDCAEKVIVKYDETLQWQATSFRAMRVVAKRWENVEVVGNSESQRVTDFSKDD